MRVATLESGQGGMRVKEEHIQHATIRTKDIFKATVLLMQISEMLFKLMNNEKSFRIEFKYNPEAKNVEIEGYATDSTSLDGKNQEH